jgi:uncharacterized protein
MGEDQRPDDPGPSGDGDGGSAAGLVTEAAVAVDGTVVADVSLPDTAPDDTHPDGADRAGATEGPAGDADGFTPEVAAKLRSYVYLLVDPRTGRPFLVGRGKGDRCFRDLASLRRNAADGGGDPVAARVGEIESAGRPVRIDILRHGLSGDDARLVEATAIDALGLAPTGVSAAGRRLPAEAVAVALAPPAKFKRAHQVVLLRQSAEDSGDRQLPAWRIARRWTDLESPRSPIWAVLVADDLVREVVRIEGWEPTGPEGDAATRYRLHGERDPKLEARYLGASVASYRTGGAHQPVTYVWCGPHWVNRPR